MKALHYAPAVVRVLLGLTFFVFGLNGFLHFLPQPPMPEAAMPFVGGLFGTVYFLPLLKSTEVICGALLLGNRFVPLALTVLAPIIINIAAFHTFLAPSPGMVIFLLATEIYLAWSYRGVFRALLSAKNTPTASPSSEPAATPALAK